jgi:hypothetical protein
MNTTPDVNGPLWRRFIRLPDTRLGRWSFGLGLAFFGLFPLWLVYAMYLRPIQRPTFFSDPLHAVLLLGAAAAAITSGFVGVLAMVAKRERSFTVLLGVLVGAFVLYWTIGELLGQ